MPPLLPKTNQNNLRQSSSPRHPNYAQKCARGGKPSSFIFVGLTKKAKKEHGRHRASQKELISSIVSISIGAISPYDPLQRSKKPKKQHAPKTTKKKRTWRQRGACHSTDFRRRWADPRRLCSSPWGATPLTTPGVRSSGRKENGSIDRSSMLKRVKASYSLDI